MQTFVPKYYFDFSCIADKCKHNCCIGWEIDIDAETYEYYKTVGAPFKYRLIDNIEVTDDVPHFKLGKDDRCPFLSEGNLCDIIRELSEEGLCQICKDHPRFRNYFDDHVEMGLGLTCEEATQIILNADLKDATTLVALDGDGDVESTIVCNSFPVRDTSFEIINDTDSTLLERIRGILKTCGADFPCKTVGEWAQIYSELEILDEAWIRELELLKDENSYTYSTQLVDYAKSIVLHSDLSVMLARLLTYFLYRHLPDGLDGGSDAGTLSNRAAFSVLSTLMIATIWKARIERDGCLTDEDIIDIARMYSSEIEYSDENLYTLIDMCI